MNQEPVEKPGIAEAGIGHPTTRAADSGTS